MTSYEEFEPEPSRGWSPGVVALVATLILLLGLGGAFAGIYLADASTVARAVPPSAVSAGFPTATEPVVAVTPSPSPSDPPATPTTTASTPVTTTSTVRGFVLPPVTGLDFRQARTDLRTLKLGVAIVFEATQEGDYTVHQTTPVAGSVVKKGITITLYVRSSAPVTAVPAMIGQDCQRAAAAIVEAGLFPEYPTGRRGVVTAQEPSPLPLVPLRWNDKVKIWCAAPAATASAA